MDPENQIEVVATGRTELATWTLALRSGADLATVDEVARLALAARRLGYTVRLRNPCARLAELLDLAGLGIEMVGETEGGEEVGVEKVVMPDDPGA